MAYNPASELVDVIDRDGRTIAVVSRQEMRERNLPHRCTYILVFNTRGELFIHLRTPTKDVYPSCWDTNVGGVLAAGESFTEGARRELLEELGIDAQPEELFPFRYEDGRTSAHAVAFRLIHDGPFRLQPEEVVRGEFVPLEEVDRRIERDLFCPDGLLVLAEYRRRHPSR